MHIPKTGGTTLHNVLSRFYDKSHSLHISSVKTAFREEALKHPHDGFLVKGHLGINEALQIPGSYLFTFLREPVARVISHYYFLKEIPSVKHYEYLNRPETTIEKFYELGEKKDIDNCLVRYVSGCHDVEFGKISETHLQLALDNLKNKIDFFGLQEFYDETLVLLASELDWPLPVYRTKNRTKKKETVSPQTMEFIRQANTWDILFYAEARKIFIQRLEKMTPKEKRKLKWLRFGNRLASAVPF